MEVETKVKRLRRRVSLSEGWTVAWWTEIFGTSAERIREAVDKVGNSADRVKEYLQASK